jgi:hypothetical protein
MSQQRRQIFREHALQQYMQRQEEDVLPQFVSPPVFLFCWLLFVLVLLAGWIAWMTRVPTYVNGTGVVATSDRRVDAQQNECDALVFVPVSESQRLHNGLHGTVEISSSGQYVDSQVSSVETQIYSPDAAQNHYKLSCSVAQSLSEPIIVLHLRVRLPANEHVQSGTVLQAHVQVGTQRILSLFPVVDELLGAS